MSYEKQCVFMLINLSLNWIIEFRQTWRFGRLCKTNISNVSHAEAKCCHHNCEGNVRVDDDGQGAAFRWDIAQHEQGNEAWNMCHWGHIMRDYALSNSIFFYPWIFIRNINMFREMEESTSEFKCSKMSHSQITAKCPWDNGFPCCLLCLSGFGHSSLTLNMGHFLSNWTPDKHE